MTFGQDSGARVLILVAATALLAQFIAVLALVNAYVMCRAVMSILRAFIGGSTRGASLFAPPAETAIA